MEIELKNVGIIREAKLEFKKGLNLIIGASSSGKSTLLRAIRSMMDNTFSDSNVSYGEKKLAIKIKDGENTAIYVRDLGSTTNKTTYKINDTVYTKVGRNPPDELSSLFKISPVEIDGEKINFNFSSQFAGPFLLLGSQSLLYSILTYRSSFDITKINDLYYSDLKKTKQELNVLDKTKETLEQERYRLNQKYDTLKDVPDMFIEMQRVKQKYEQVESLRKTITRFKELLSAQELERDRVNQINALLVKFPDVFEQYRKFQLLFTVQEKREVLARLMSIGSMDALNTNIERLNTLYNASNTISTYISIREKSEALKAILVKLNGLPELRSLELLTYYTEMQESIEDEKTSRNTIENEQNEIEKCINAVGVCPLCNQPLDSHKH
jgi:DNA repair ATPase RecN